MNGGRALPKAHHRVVIDCAVQFVSEAACERVFSVLQNSFDDRQESALRDYIEGKVMVRYNTRKGQ